ncbi:M12 family metallopeptidase [Roseateles sp. DC23W]|uniref:M12 family metallopeptidase n=1 Tax=Pelomonas dachongensis TaxID=3299029 RepID=A0ABW7ESL7_9BURK
MSEADGLHSTDYRLGFHKPIGSAWQPVIYSAVNINGTRYAVLEGCILIGTVEEQDKLVDRIRQQSNSEVFTDPDFVMQGGAIKGGSYRWPNGRVPYVISGSLLNKQRIEDAISHWNGLATKIRLVARTNEKDWVEFVPGPGCASYVGRRGGRQEIVIGDACSAGNVMHEIGHCVGFYHEQSRSDRDQHVQIEWANVNPTMRHNFNQENSVNLGAYDFGSIMHYPATAFSVNGQPTIVPRQPLPPGINMGQRNGLSSGDVAAVQQLYP